MNMFRSYSLEMPRHLQAKSEPRSEPLANRTCSILIRGSTLCGFSTMFCAMYAKSDLQKVTVAFTDMSKFFFSLGIARYSKIH